MASPAEAKSSDQKEGSKKKAFWAMGIILLLVVLASAMGSDSDTSTTSSDKTSVEASSAKAEDSAVAEVADESEAKPDTPDVPIEYRSALIKATSYAETMHMSKAGVYDQLVSEYGEGFTAEAAQYAIDNLNVDWNANALAKANSYQSDMAMSPAAIRDQLVSEYGEKFTEEEANYAMQHLQK